MPQVDSTSLPKPVVDVISWEAQTVRQIRKLHAEACALAAEIGRWQAAEGHDLRSPFDICDALDDAFRTGWNDEKSGKP